MRRLNNTNSDGIDIRISQLVLFKAFATSASASSVYSTCIDTFTTTHIRRCSKMCNTHRSVGALCIALCVFANVHASLTHKHTSNIGHSIWLYYCCSRATRQPVAANMLVFDCNSPCFIYVFYSLLHSVSRCSIDILARALVSKIWLPVRLFAGEFPRSAYIFLFRSNGGKSATAPQPTASNLVFFSSFFFFLLPLNIFIYSTNLDSMREFIL